MTHSIPTEYWLVTFLLLTFGFGWFAGHKYKREVDDGDFNELFTGFVEETDRADAEKHRADMLAQLLHTLTEERNEAIKHLERHREMLEKRSHRAIREGLKRGHGISNT